MFTAKIPQEKTHRWWIQYVVVPLAVAVVSGVLGYKLRPIEANSTRDPSVNSQPISRDLLAPGTIELLASERTPDLQSLNSQIKEAIRRGDLPGARELTGRLLAAYPFSPRGNYAKACILSLLSNSMTDSTARSRCLDESEQALRNALDYGFTNFLKLYLNQCSPTVWILNDSDLAPLMARSDARKLVEEFSSEDAAIV
jgi:hypothetical protein